ncbi:unnamed protein product [Nesidiocoris tenuis]|uniref:Uncharacterized protein n=1 Tax=Nesidiocoris tenuis TaxID=355587 RepID=A0A6H5GAE1_9HEMI|nr:unnamed protein product [Nesidiocoris tenuis]
MPSGKSRPERKSQRESGEDSEDESEVLEESPCGRWLKRREECPSLDIDEMTTMYTGILASPPGRTFPHLRSRREEETSLVKWFDCLSFLRASYSDRQSLSPCFSSPTRNWTSPNSEVADLASYTKFQEDAVQPLPQIRLSRVDRQILDVPIIVCIIEEYESEIFLSFIRRKYFPALAE